MSDINRVTLSGTIVEAPVTRFTQAGNEICSCWIIVERSWGSGNDRQTARDRFQVVSFKGTAQRLARLKRGLKVNLDGYLSSRSYTDKQGVERFSTEITAQRIDEVIEHKNHEEIY